MLGEQDYSRHFYWQLIVSYWKVWLWNQVSSQITESSAISSWRILDTVAHYHYQRISLLLSLIIIVIIYILVYISIIMIITILSLLLLRVLLLPLWLRLWQLFPIIFWHHDLHDFPRPETEEEDEVWHPDMEGSSVAVRYSEMGTHWWWIYCGGCGNPLVFGDGRSCRWWLGTASYCPDQSLFAVVEGGSSQI